MVKNYDPASPIQILGDLVTTERSGLGKWGTQCKSGAITLCRWMRINLPLNSIIAEVGCYAGELTSMMAIMSGTVHAIDPWLNGYDDDDLSSHIIPMEQVYNSFVARAACHNNIRIHKGKSEDEVNSFEDNKLDFVYIDAIHKLGPCRDDIKRWIPKIKDGGYIGGHDFCGYWGEVVDAVLETVGLPDYRFKDGSWTKQICH